MPVQSALTHHLSALGLTGMTAYFGLLHIGRPQRGETVVISAAAGATGNVAGGVPAGLVPSKLVTHRLRMEGFIVLDYLKEWPAAGAQRGWSLRKLTATPIARARIGILAVLLALTAGAWAVILTGHSGGHHDEPTMGLSVPLYRAAWLAMTVAMMFPAVAPMVLMFARVSASRRTSGQAHVSTWLFVSGYLLLWTGIGVISFALASAAQQWAAHSDWVSAHATRLGSALIVLAGVYQFSRLKGRCLSQCRSPMGFVMQHWRSGRLGADGGPPRVALRRVLLGVDGRDVRGRDDEPRRAGYRLSGWRPPRGPACGSFTSVPRP